MNQPLTLHKLPNARRSRNDELAEALERLRRIETMLFVLCEHEGINPRTKEKINSHD